MTINHELRRVEALSIRRLDPDDTELYTLITNVRDALDELAHALQSQVE
jgi:hypothetical protein